MRSALLVFTMLLLSPAAASAQTAGDPAKIIVAGSGEVQTVPDLATITYTLRGEGRTSDEAVRAMVAMADRIISSIASVDPAAEPKTDKVQVTPVTGADCNERDYGPKRLSTGVCATIGYVAEQSVILRSGAVANAGTIVGLVARGGAEDARVEKFGLRDAASAERQAIAAALADAQSKAAAAAAASHVGLGSLLSLSVSGRSDEQMIVVTGSRMPQANAPARPRPVVVTLTPEPITTSASVSATYAIQR